MARHDVAAIAGNLHYAMARHAAGHSSDSSLLSHDYSPRVKRIERPRLWMRWGSVGHTSNESLESLCQQCYKQKSLAKLGLTQGKAEGRSERSDDGRPQAFRRRDFRPIVVTEVISGTGFYAVSEEDQEKVAELRAAVVAQLGDSPTMVKQVVPRMVCALKMNDSWERVSVVSHCTLSCCLLRVDSEAQASPQEYWHVRLMEVGTTRCVALSQLALITRQLASENRMARLYFLRRIRLKDVENGAQAKEYLKSQIMTNQSVMAEVFYRVGRDRTFAEIVMGDNNYLSDVLVKAGFARYRRYSKQERWEKMSGAAGCCSSQDLVSISSRDSLQSHVPQPPTPAPATMKSDVVNSTLPELMELIDHLMKQRKGSTYLTFGGSALNLAIKTQNREKAADHQGLCEHGYASLNKYQLLLRRLRSENPYSTQEIMDLKDSLYDQLVGMFEKWKASYREAQKRSDIAIGIVANIFLNFTNVNFGLVKYKHKCKTLEAALSNEVLLQNEGQDLAQMIVPAVAKKLMCSIEKLETSASGFLHSLDRPQTLHQFITSSKNITSLTLETLAKDILKGLYHYHVRGIAYKHLHPENVLMIKGHATLRAIEDQKVCKIGQGWPFKNVEAPSEDLDKPSDVYNFGLLVLWMACKGADNFFSATIKFYCNVALIKMTMAEDPNQRPLVESMVCNNSSVFRSNSQWRSMPLKDYLKEVFNDKCTAEAGEESFDQPSETGESTSESEGIFQPNTEEESGNETTESEAPKSKPPTLMNSGRDGKETPHSRTEEESGNETTESEGPGNRPFSRMRTEREGKETPQPCTDEESENEASGSNQSSLTTSGKGTEETLPHAATKKE